MCPMLWALGYGVCSRAGEESIYTYNNLTLFLLHIYRDSPSPLTREPLNPKGPGYVVTPCAPSGFGLGTQAFCWPKSLLVTTLRYASLTLLSLSMLGTCHCSAGLPAVDQTWTRVRLSYPVLPGAFDLYSALNSPPKLECHVKCRPTKA